MAYVPPPGEKDLEKIVRSIRNAHERLDAILYIPQSRGIDCYNNASTPTTKFDLDADEIMLRTSTGAGAVRINPGSAITNDTGSAGPVTNGRDQSGAFSNSTWLHFYWIWDGTTLATISSTVAPPTGPTFPTGYTHWAYAGAVFKDSGGNLHNVRIKGSMVFRDVIGSALSGGSGTSETTVSLTSFIPPNALSVSISSVGTLTTNAGGAASENVLLRHVSGSNGAAFGVYVEIASSTSSQVAAFDFPNVSQQVFYLWSNIAGPANVNTRSLTMHVRGYRVPNGGE